MGNRGIDTLNGLSELCATSPLLLYQASPKLGVAHLSVTKNGDSHDVPLSRRSKRCRSFASAASNNSECFLIGNAVRLAFEHLRVRAGMSDLHFHDLRHEGTSRLFEAGFSIEQVALVTGHKDWKMLRRYTHLKPETLHSIRSVRVA